MRRYVGVQNVLYSRDASEILFPKRPGTTITGNVVTDLDLNSGAAAPADTEPAAGPIRSDQGRGGGGRTSSSSTPSSRRSRLGTLGFLCFLWPSE